MLSRVLGRLLGPISLHLAHSLLMQERRELTGGGRKIWALSVWHKSVVVQQVRACPGRKHSRDGFRIIFLR